MSYTPTKIGHLEVNTSTKHVHIFDTVELEEIVVDVDTARQLAQYILDTYGPPDGA